jgi:hypothetical protein
MGDLAVKAVTSDASAAAPELRRRISRANLRDRCLDVRQLAPLPPAVWRAIPLTPCAAAVATTPLD